MTSYQESVPMTLLAFSVGTGVLTVIFAASLAYVVMKQRKQSRLNDQGAESFNSTESKVIHDASTLKLDHSKYPGGCLSIYFGSQTGTAESFAKQIARECDKRGFLAKIVDLEEVVEDNINQSIRNERMRDSMDRNRAIFLMATYGEGEPTDNAVTFIRGLRNMLNYSQSEEDDLKSEEKKIDGEDNTSANHHSTFHGLDFAVFGLGNKQYENFNAMGKFVNDALGKLGARRILELSLGDDDKDLEGDFESWKDNMLWPVLVKEYLSDRVQMPIVREETLPDCHFSVDYVDGHMEPDPVTLENVHLSSKFYYSSVECPIQCIRELRSNADGGSTLHVEIDISKSTVAYQTADNLGILPVNDIAIVETLAKALHYDLDATFKLKTLPGHESKNALLFPNPCTVREFLQKYCDLTSAPRRAELKLLAAYARDPICKKALLRMSAKEGKDEYRDKILDAHIGIADIISCLCPSIQMPLEHFIQLCPRLQPRYYTISSSSSVHPDSVHITVSVIKSQLKDGKVFKGVCSNYLAGLSAHSSVRIFCRPSTFRLPSNPSTPIIMFGPGTGIAPMRALLQERNFLRLEKKFCVGKNVLYFGCKDGTKDFLYKNELEDLQRNGTLSHLYLAFSRETKEKIYVQNLLARNADETWRLIHTSCAYIYVCGGVKMGQDVTETLRRIFSETGGLTSAESKSYLDKMASNGRFVQELWS